MKKKNIRVVVQILLCSLMLFSTIGIAYGASDEDTGRQPVRDYIVGDEVPNQGEGDVTIHGEAYNPDLTVTPSVTTPPTTTPSATPTATPTSSPKPAKVGGGAYDPVTGAKTVKTGDVMENIFQYGIILVLSGAVFLVLLKNQKKKNA